MSDDPSLTPDDDNQPSSAANVTGDSAANPEQRRSKQSQALREANERETFWKSVFANPIGRREMWRTVFGSGATHIAETRFPAGEIGFPDPNAAWYARGQQDMGQQILAELSVLAREGVWQMQDEYDRRFPQSPKPKRRAGES